MIVLYSCMKYFLFLFSVGLAPVLTSRKMIRFLIKNWNLYYFCLEAYMEIDFNIISMYLCIRSFFSASWLHWSQYLVDDGCSHATTEIIIFYKNSFKLRITDSLSRWLFIMLVLILREKIHQKWIRQNHWIFWFISVVVQQCIAKEIV